MQLPLGKETNATIISAYAPTMTNPEEAKDTFYGELDSLINSVKSEKLILGDFNARVGPARTSRYQKLHDTNKFYDALKEVYGPQISGSSLLLDADGTTLLTEKKLILEGSVDGLSSVCDNFGLTISTKKTEVMFQPAPGNQYHEPQVQTLQAMERISMRAKIKSGRHRQQQCFNNVLWFTVVFSASCLVFEAVKTYTVSQITSLERQFGLSSTRSGLLLSCNEIGYLSAIFFFSHFGARHFIPRIISCALAVYGVASFMSGLLHFVSPVLHRSGEDVFSNYSSHERARLCLDSLQETKRCPVMNDQANDNGHWVYNVLAVCMVLLGVGKSPRFSLGLHYLDNNSSDKQQSSLLTSITMTVSFLGPCVALNLGGWFSSIPVDSRESQLDVHHPQWIGAWWIGFLVIGCAAIILAVPLGCFPRHIKKPAVNAIATSKSFKDDLVDLPKSILRILKNPVVACLLLGKSSIVFFVGGYVSFTPKYLESQFTKSAAEANFICGILELVWAIVGTLLGGILTSRLRLNSVGCMKLTAIVIPIGTLLYGLTLVLGCENQHIKGLGDGRNAMINDTVCNCDPNEFMPLCGVDGVTYINPCIAGCQSYNGTTYSGCAEIAGNEGRAGRCQTECPYFYPYVIVDMVSGIVATIALVPVVITLMKIVHPRDKSMAVAISSFLNSFVGFLPSPIVYGMVIDTTCTLWENACGELGACALYDLPSLRYRVKLMDTGLQLLSSAAFFAAFLLLKYGVVKESTDPDAGNV
ncbi:solute carrier organic anion transporter family member 2A1-like [Haliotis asinina]|uniref:solute carrier organic anion transporter family member 2A1-like n=1 Tax=Haliotis asinina TaxID=109174 RepID=UPI0035322154